MPKSGLKHIDVGPELTKTEWESEESHEVVHGTSFPSSPIERQLFYRDDEHKWYIYSGSAWVWLGGGGGGGMAVHGNEYHDPDFATEAALASHATAATGIHGVGASTVESASGSQSKVDTHAAATTGVHGVGSAYIAKSSADGLDLADHDSRHGYLGADELPVLYLNAQRAIPVIHKHFGDLGGLTEGHSGGSLVLGIVYGTLRSGSTTNNYGRVYMSQPCYHAYASYGHTLGIKISIRQSTQQDMWLGWFESTTPGTNQNHYAFRITNNNLYAYAGKSDTYKENSGSLATWSGTRDFFLSIRDSSDAIKFYVDHTLAYSVTTSANRPTAASLYLVFYLKTTEASSKDCFLCPFTLFTAHNH